MKKFLLVTICTLCAVLTAFAQDNSLVTKGKKAFDEGKFRDAERYYSAAAASNSANQKMYATFEEQLASEFKVARNLYDNGDYIKAIESLRRFEDMKMTKYDDVYYLVGHCYKMKGEYQLAEEWYRKAIKRGNKFGYYCLGMLYKEKRIPGTEQDMVDAFVAADNNYSKRELAFYYHEKDDVVNAAKWVQACNDENNNFQFLKAQYYSNGYIKDQNADQKAATILKNLYQKGYASAIVYLASKSVCGEPLYKVEDDVNLRKRYGNGWTYTKEKGVYYLPDFDKVYSQSREKIAPPITQLTSRRRHVNPFDPTECWNDVEMSVGYKYAKQFPLALNVTFHNDWSSHYYVWGLETGVNFDKHEYERIKIDGNMLTSRSINPKFYLSLIQGVNLRWVSFNLGVGALFSSEDRTVSSDYTSSMESPNLSLDNKVTVSFSASAPTITLLLQPSVALNIPLCEDDYYLSFNVGYNYLPWFKELNGISAGVSFSFGF